MFDALFVAATGMRAHQAQVDVISNNVANVNTTGFRREMVTFDALTASFLTTQADPAAEAVQAALSKGAGTVAKVGLDMGNGDLRQTGAPLDIAVDGLGFLEVVREDGSPAFTRAGVLRVSPEGMLTTLGGQPLAARILVPADSVSLEILSDGRVLSRVADQTEAVEIGRIELSAFVNPQALTATGNGLYVAGPDTGEQIVGVPGEQGLGIIRQGYLEGSNVQLTDELVTLMLAQRAFEMNSRIFQAADQMLSITNALSRS